MNTDIKTFIDSNLNNDLSSFEDSSHNNLISLGPVSFNLNNFDDSNNNNNNMLVLANNNTNNNKIAQILNDDNKTIGDFIGDILDDSLLKKNLINSGILAKKINKPVSQFSFKSNKKTVNLKNKAWSAKDTDRLMDLLKVHGTDFSAIAHELGNKTRTQVKNKFKKLDDANPALMTQLLKRN